MVSEKSASQPCEELNLPLRNTFKEPVFEKSVHHIHVLKKKKLNYVSAPFNMFINAWDSPVKKTKRKSDNKLTIGSFLKASRVRGSFKIPPTDGSRVCRPIGLKWRQLGRVREEREIVDHGNVKERVVTFEKQEYV